MNDSNKICLKCTVEYIYINNITLLFLLILLLTYLTHENNARWNSSEHWSGIIMSSLNK